MSDNETYKLNVDIVVGANIRRIRKERHLSQEKLSQICGISAPHLSRIERGITSTTISTLNALADGLGVEPAKLFEKLPLESLVYVYTRLPEK